MAAKVEKNLRKNIKIPQKGRNALKTLKSQEKKNGYLKSWSMKEQNLSAYLSGGTHEIASVSYTIDLVALSMDFFTP
jgi:hypothetical protein